MLAAVQRTMAERSLFHAGDRVVAGVSGGADSIALLYALHFLRPRLSIALSVAHLHHGLRGAEADADEALVTETCARLGLICRTGRADVAAEARAQGISLEMAARAARRRFFQESLAEAGASTLALAHTADDQAETVLLRLARGAGGQGLGGMAYATPFCARRLVRPFLDIRHAEVVAWLTAHRLAWREDASNTDLRFLRNRVRHRVLPLLERELNPSVRDALIRAAEVLREDDAWLNEAAGAALRRVRPGRAGSALVIEKLLREPLALRRRLLRRWLMEQGVPPERVDFALLGRIDELLGPARGLHWVPVGEGGRVVAEYGRLRLEREERRTASDVSSDASDACVALPVPGEAAWDAAGLVVRATADKGYRRRREPGIGQGPTEAWISAARRAGRPLALRARRAGDRLTPCGADGARKLKDILIDLKVPRAQRDRLPLVVCGEEIVWLPGYRIARGWEVENADAPSIRLQAVLMETLA